MPKRELAAVPLIGGGYLFEQRKLRLNIIDVRAVCSMTVAVNALVKRLDQWLGPGLN